MSDDWTITPPADGGLAQIVHREAPRFAAIWQTGPADLDAVDGPFWIDEGSGADAGDAILIHGFAWHDPRPDQARFEALMRQAARAVDGWITGQL